MRTTRSDALVATNLPKFTVLSPLKIRRKETLFEEFYKITSAQNLTLQGLLRYHGRLRTRKPYLRLAVQLKKLGFILALILRVEQDSSVRPNDWSWWIEP